MPAAREFDRGNAMRYRWKRNPRLQVPAVRGVTQDQKPTGGEGSVSEGPGRHHGTGSETSLPWGGEGNPPGPGSGEGSRLSWATERRQYPEARGLEGHPPGPRASHRARRVDCHSEATFRWSVASAFPGTASGRDGPPGNGDIGIESGRSQPGGSATGAGPGTGHRRLSRRTPRHRALHHRVHGLRPRATGKTGVRGGGVPAGGRPQRSCSAPPFPSP